MLINGIHQTDVSNEELELHLRLFIKTFVNAGFQDRWVEFLIDKRHDYLRLPRSKKVIKLYTKANDLLRSFSSNDYCKKLKSPLTTNLNSIFLIHDQTGIYYLPGKPPVRLSILEAEAHFNVYDDSAILSFKAGEYALFFCHGSGIWECERLLKKAIGYDLIPLQ